MNKKQARPFTITAWDPTGRYPIKAQGPLFGALENAINPKKEPKAKFWTAKEDEVLIRYYRKVQTRVLSIEMGRSVNSIVLRAKRLKITGGVKRPR